MNASDGTSGQDQGTHPEPGLNAEGVRLKKAALYYTADRGGEILSNGNQVGKISKQARAEGTTRIPLYVGCTHLIEAAAAAAAGSCVAHENERTIMQQNYIWKCLLFCIYLNLQHLFKNVYSFRGVCLLTHSHIITELYTSYIKCSVSFSAFAVK